jgi:hypothetical protein
MEKAKGKLLALHSFGIKVGSAYGAIPNLVTSSTCTSKAFLTGSAGKSSFSKRLRAAFWAIKFHMVIRPMQTFRACQLVQAKADEEEYSQAY